MNYYAIGDRTYVISHHGVIGMHWGVRRFQPYGQGYDRKGGKTGKVVGEAKKSHQGLREKLTLNKIKSLDNQLSYSKQRDDAVLNRKLRMAGALAYAADTEKNAKKKEKLDKRSDHYNEDILYLAKGMRKYDDIVKKHRDALSRSINDPAYKKTAEYKQAKKAFNKQLWKTSFVGYGNLRIGMDHAKALYGIDMWKEDQRSNK